MSVYRTIGPLVSVFQKKRERLENDYYEDHHAREPEVEEPKQCLGPGCIEPAKQGSKYCSDECGMKLARRLVRLNFPIYFKFWITFCHSFSHCFVDSLS